MTDDRCQDAKDRRHIRPPSFVVCPAYTEFAVASNFSFLRGASHPEELMLQAADVGLSGLGLCDRNSVAGVVRAHLVRREKELTLRYHPGARLVFADGTPDILAYPRDRAGWGRLCRLLTRGNARAEKGDCILFLDDVLEFCDGLELVVMEQCTRDDSSPGKSGEALPHVTSPLVREVDRRSISEDGREGSNPRGLSLISTPLPNPPPQGGRGPAVRGERSKQTNKRQELHLLSRLLAAAPGRVRLAASMLYRGNDRARLARCMALAREANVPLIAVNDVLFHHPDRRPLADVLTCVREHLVIDRAGRRLAANAERYLKPPEEMARLFRDAPEAIAETAKLSAALTFSLDELRYEYPDEIVEGFATAQEALAHLAYTGAAKHYPGGIPDKVRQSLEHELGLIAELNYAPYFLTVYDIVRFAREQGILCQGRGSAANSAVCFCLGITEVDPSVHDLLFGRFISSSRNEPPDIDVDFEHERREEVIQYIYRRYGRERAGIAATVISYRGRSAIREVGKVFGLSEDTIGALSSSIWGGGGGVVERKALARVGLNPQSRCVRQITALVGKILSFPRHLSQHVGGFVITRGRLDEVVPIMNAAMEERTNVEWDKDDLDALGILKVDVLGLGMLTCIRKAFELAEKHYGVSFRVPQVQTRHSGTRAQPANPESITTSQGGSDTTVVMDSGLRLRRPRNDSAEVFSLALVPQHDPAVYCMLCRADSLGVFQVESRAQMSMLPRLKPKTFYDLVIEVAIVRPGPIQGDMVHPYLRRRQGLESVEFPSEELRNVLGKTLGVPLFQEQAMKIVIVAAGFTPGEADRLRRAMATFKRVGTIGTFQRKMVEGMVARGYQRDFAERCFHQIEGFGEYGFPESHAASFALLVYASAWLKCHYPDVFAAALLNAQPMGFYASAQIVRDVRDHGVEVRPVDVNFSDYDSTLEPGPRAAERLHHLHAEMRHDIQTTHAIRLGLREVKGLSEDDARRIVALRAPQPYTSIRDLWLRTGLAPRVIERLADADAFGSLGLTRRQALWQAKALGRVGDCDDDLPLFRAAASCVGGTSLSPSTACSLSQSISDVSDVDPLLNDRSRVDPTSAGGGDGSRQRERKEPHVALPPMGLGEEVVNDYRFLRLSLRAHPASFLRAELSRRGIVANDELRRRRSGARVTVSGLVTCRQRPGSAQGVVFITIEDETALANVIVWPKMFERFRPIVLGARYIAVSGPMQEEEGVIHVVAERLDDLTPLLARLAEGPAVESPAHRDDARYGRSDDGDPREFGGRRPPLEVHFPHAPEIAGDLDVPTRGSAHAPNRRAR